MVRVKYRYVVSVVSVGEAPTGGSTGSNSGTLRSHSRPPAYPGCPPIGEARSCAFSDDALLFRAIRRSVQSVHGVFGTGRIMARFRIVYWNPFSGLLITRVLRGLSTEQLSSALALITSIHDGSNELPAVFDVIHRSGTVRCCQKFIIDFYKTHVSSCIAGVKETAMARAVARRLTEAKPPELTFDLY